MVIEELPPTSQMFENTTQQCFGRECYEPSDSIIDTAGRIIAWTGVVGTALFFGSPVVVAGIVPLTLLGYKTIKPEGCVNEGWIFVSTITVAPLIIFTWNPVKNFVYSEQVATIGTIAGGSIIATGLLLRGISACINRPVIIHPTVAQNV